MNSQRNLFSRFLIQRTVIVLLFIFLLPISSISQQLEKLSNGRKATLKSLNKSSAIQLPSDNYPPSYGEAYAGIERYEYISDIQKILDYQNKKLTISIFVFVSNPDSDEKDYGAGEYVNVWIDWNKNGTFEKNEQVLDQIKYAKGIGFTGTLEFKEEIDIPQNAPTETWMRVVLGYGYDPGAIDSWYYGSSKTQPIAVGQYVMGEITSFYLDDVSSTNSIAKTSAVQSNYNVNETLFPNLDPYHGFWTGKEFTISNKLEGEIPFRNNEYWDPQRWDNVKISFDYTPIKGLGRWEKVHIGIYKELQWWNKTPIYKKQELITLEDPSNNQKPKESFIPGNIIASLDKGDYYLVVAFKRPYLEYPKYPPIDSYKIFKFKILRWPYYISTKDAVKPNKKWNEAIAKDQINHQRTINFFSSLASGSLGAFVALATPATFGANIIVGTLTSMLVAEYVTQVSNSDAWWALSNYGKVRGDISWNYRFRLAKYEWKGVSYEKTQKVDWYRKDYFRNLTFTKIGYYRGGQGIHFFPKWIIDVGSEKKFMNPEDWPPTPFKLGQFPNPKNYTGYNLSSPKILVREGVNNIKPYNWHPEFVPNKMKIGLKGNTYGLEVKAKDPDSFKLNYEWWKSGGEWKDGEPTTNQATWFVPSEPGFYRFKVKVSDERDGYSELWNFIDIRGGSEKTNSLNKTPSFIANVITGFTESIVDDNGDGLADSLNISMTVDTSDSLFQKFSSFEIGAVLAIPQLDTIKVVASSSSIVDSSNIGHVTLRFIGEAIRGSGHTGSFLLKDLSVTGLTELGRSQFILVENAFETKSYQSENFAKSSIELRGVVSDKGVDLDNDGLFDMLSIGLELNILETSDISVSGFLTNRQGDIIANEIINVDSMQVGINQVELNFLGEPFRTANMAGPYTLKNVMVYNPDNLFHFDTLKTPYVTKSYQPEDFETIPIELNTIVSDKGVDTDNDGLYNLLQIEADVTIVQEGKYNFYGTLVDSDSNDVTYASNTFQLGQGEQKILLSFEGLKIFNSEVNGPYILTRLETMKMDDPTGFSLQSRPNFLTNNYQYSEFQAPPIEISNNFSESTMDHNNDGKHDELLIDFDVQVVTPNEYRIIGSLKDAQNNSITHSIQQSAFDKGTATVQISFSGNDIGDSGKDGPYKVDIKIVNDPGHIVDSGRDLFTTSAYSFTEFKRSSARFTRVFRDSTIDLNQNSLYDALTISTSIAVTDLGKFQLVGKLSDFAGNQISEDRRSFDFTPGVNEVSLEFPGTRINQHGKNGPYILSEILLYDMNQSTWPVVDFYQHADTTRAYEFTKFEGSIASIHSTFSDFGFDNDNNNLFDYLTIEVAVDILQNGQEFYLDGSLYDNNGVFIQKVRASKSLQLGSGMIALSFDGYRIRGHGESSPYQLRHLTLMNNKFKVIEYLKNAYSTKEYEFTQFETSLADLRVQVSNVTVAEGLQGDNKYLLKTTVYNFGGEQANSVAVRFLDNAVQIGSDILVPVVSGAEPVTTEAIWEIANATGNHRISIQIDPDSSIKEIDENNNSLEFDITLPITDFPAIPENVVALRTNSGMRISWNAGSEYISGYNVYRSTQSGGNYVKLNRELIESPVFDDPDILAESIYYYVITAVRNGFPSIEGAYSGETTQQLAVDAKLNQYSSKPDSSFVLPIILGDLMNAEVFSIDIKLDYDPNVLVAKEASTLGTIAQSWGDPSYSIKPNGQIWIAMAGISALPGSGEVVNIMFTVVGAAGDTSSLELIECTLNEGDPPTVLQNGSFKVENVTAVKEERFVEAPETFVLFQNYPNPFNPSTTIRYSIPPSAQDRHVTLEIFNTLGEKVTTLVDQQQPSGDYSIKWNGLDDSLKQVSSGIYLFRLSTSSFTEVKKMLFLQ